MQRLRGIARETLANVRSAGPNRYDVGAQVYRPTSPFPAIGEISPREAVGTPEGRAKVIGWLKYLENGESRRAQKQGMPPYDFTWMWRQLGVLEERR